MSGKESEFRSATVVEYPKAPSTPKKGKLTAEQKKELETAIYQGNYSTVEEILKKATTLSKTPYDIAKFMMSNTRKNPAVSSEEIERQEAIEKAIRNKQSLITRLFLGGKRRTQKQKRKSRKYTRKH
jgi:hypothetical protein